MFKYLNGYQFMSLSGCILFIIFFTLQATFGYNFFMFLLLVVTLYMAIVGSIGAVAIYVSELHLLKEYTRNFEDDFYEIGKMIDNIESITIESITKENKQVKEKKKRGRPRKINN